MPSRLRSVVQVRLYRLFMVVARAAAPLSTPLIASRMGWSLPTTRAHLAALAEKKLVVRTNYRRWGLARDVDPRSVRADSL